ncbi:MAG TPA: adenosylmethionine decarboxylase [Ktedonobacterales bacterium]
MFGPHLILDGSKCNTQKLGNRILIEQLLNDYPRAIGMTKIGGPYMFEYQAPDPEYSGVSGLVVIAESHIAIHTFPELDYFTMDIFSCRNFDHETAIAYIKEALEVQEMDRILLQRGLSFHGPHHGAFGSDAETGQPLQRAAGAGRRADDLTSLADKRDGARAHLAERDEQFNQTGRMIWPQYGVTPDYGTYGADAPDPATNKGNGKGKAHAASKATAARTSSTLELTPTDPIQINPTASISGLLDKMSGLGSEGNRLAAATNLWERMVRDADCTILLGLSGPLISAGLRELLVYLIEHRAIDGLIVSADNLFHDLHEARGARHYQSAASITDANLFASGYERAADLFAAHDDLRQTEAMLVEFSATLAQETTLTTSAFFRRLGAALRHMAPRKGVIQAAAEAGIPLYAPDIASSAFGTALAAARVQGKASLHFDTAGDALELANALASAGHSGVILVGSGSTAPADLLRQAARLSPSPSLHRYSVTLGGTDALPAEESVASSTDPTLALPLVVHALAQRCPGLRPQPRRKAVAELVSAE